MQPTFRPGDSHVCSATMLQTPQSAQRLVFGECLECQLEPFFALSFDPYDPAVQHHTHTALNVRVLLFRCLVVVCFGS